MKIIDEKEFYEKALEIKYKNIAKDDLVKIVSAFGEINRIFIKLILCKIALK